MDRSYPTLANQFQIRMYFTPQSLILPMVQPLGPGMGGRVLKYPVYEINFENSKENHRISSFAEEYLNVFRFSFKDEYFWLINKILTLGIIINFIINCVLDDWNLEKIKIKKRAINFYNNNFTFSIEKIFWLDVHNLSIVREKKRNVITHLKVIKGEGEMTPQSSYSPKRPIAVGLKG